MHDGFGCCMASRDPSSLRNDGSSRSCLLAGLKTLVSRNPEKTGRARTSSAWASRTDACFSGESRLRPLLRPRVLDADRRRLCAATSWAAARPTSAPERPSTMGSGTRSRRSGTTMRPVSMTTFPLRDALIPGLRAEPVETGTSRSTAARRCADSRGAGASW